MINIGGGGGGFDDLLDDDGFIKPEYLPDPISTIPKVDKYADLPSATDSSGKMYRVLLASGTWVLGNKRNPGFYESDGSGWIYLGTTIDRVTPAEIEAGASAGIRRFTATDVASIVRKHQTIKESFETISKNLKGLRATFTFVKEVLISIEYDLTNGSITKSFSYDSANNNRLSTITLSGDVPPDVALIKTLHYTGTQIAFIDYGSG